MDDNPASPTYGKTIATPTQFSPGDRVKRLIAAALTGLAAGSEVPQQKSGLASALAGAGAGFKAVQKQNQQQDALKRQQAQKDFADKQSAIMQQYEIARSNSLNYSTHMANLKMQNDLDPIRKSNATLAGDLSDAGLETQFMSEAELRAAQTADPSLITNHLILPIGYRPVTDSEGNPILNADKSPREEATFALVTGFDKNKQIALPAAMETDLQKYGKLAGISNFDTLKSGDPVSARDFLTLYHKISEAKKSALQGDVKPELVLVNDDKGGQTLKRRNTVTGDLSEPSATELQTWKKGEADIARIQSETNKNKTEANKTSNENSKQALTAAYDAARLEVESARDELKAAQSEFDEEGIKAAKEKLDGAVATFNQATANLQSGGQSKTPKSKTPSANNQAALDAKSQQVAGIIKALPPDQQLAQINASQTLTPEEKAAVKKFLKLPQ